MRSKIRLAAFLLFLLGCAQLIYLAASNGKASPAPAAALAHAAQENRPAPVNLALTVDKPVAVDFSASSATLADLSPREREDQQRDWLLFTAAASLGLPADAYAQIFFDLPSLRQGYMRPVAVFEYGKTRSRLVRDGVVLALLPAGVSDQQRRDDLAHVADTHRKTQGGKFDRIMVVEYTLDSAAGKGSLTARKDVPYQRVYSAEYGYVEREIGDRKSLDAFMAAIDDLTLMRKTANGLLLGGRKSQASPKKNIGVEEVATVWQSEQHVQQELARFESFVKEQRDEFDAKWKDKTYRYEHERETLERQARADADALRARVAEYRREHQVRPGSGFSLDPEFDYPRLAQAFGRFSETLLPVLDEDVTEESVQEITAALEKGNAGPYERLKRHNNHPLIGPLLTKMEEKFAFQAARYDGKLQGTEVGMVLFYTDLLAKLWTIDFMQTSPARGLMPAFLDDLAAYRTMSPIYRAEADELSQARLWFGHTDQGYQLSSTGDAVLLAPNATRIFSAGTNPEKPGEEVETSAFLAASIDWWNDHYEEVATLEPQYQRLNQIMKWSVLIAWLNSSNDGDKLKFLEDVQVRRDLSFNRWTSQHRDLRFTKWSAVGLRPPGTNGIATESMPLLRGEVTSGGVSLASKQELKLGALTDDVAPRLRRSSLQRELSTESAVLKAADDTAFRFRQAEGAAVVSATPKGAAKLRAQSAELANAEIEHVFKVNGGKLELQSKVGGKPLDSLHIERAGNGFSAGLHADDVAHAHRLANLAARDPSPHTLLADPMVEALIRLGDDGAYALRLRDSGRWVRLDPEREASVALESGWLMRAAPAVPEARVMRAKLMSDAELLGEMSDKVHFAVRFDRHGRSFLEAATPPPSSAPLGSVDTGGGIVRSFVDPADKAIYLAAETAWSEPALQMASRLGKAQIEAMRKGGKLVLRPDGTHSAPLIAALKKQNYREAAASMAASPVDARREMAKALADESRHNATLLATLGPDDALHHIDELIGVYGPQPELLVRKGLLQIERGNLEAAVEIAARRPRRPLPDRSGLFDEINARIVAGQGVSDNLLRYAQYVDQVNANLGKQSAGFLRPTIKESQFDFDYVFNTRPAGATVTNPAGIPEGAAVYRQASPSLNGVDWNASLNSSMGQVLQGNLGKILHLTEDSIADYRPSVIWVPDSAGGQVKLTATTSGTAVRAGARARCSSEDADSHCGRDRHAPRDVYLVMAN